MSESNPVHKCPNRAGNTDIPLLDYSKWFNRVRGYAWSTYIMIVTSVVCGFIALALDEKSDGRGWTTVRDSWEDWKKNICDIAAEKGLQRLVSVTCYAVPHKGAATEYADNSSTGVYVVVAGGNGKARVIEYVDQFVNTR